MIAKVKLGSQAATNGGITPDFPSDVDRPSANQYSEPNKIANPRLRPRIRLRGRGSRLNDRPSATMIRQENGNAYLRSR